MDKNNVSRKLIEFFTVELERKLGQGKGYISKELNYPQLSTGLIENQETGEILLAISIGKQDYIVEVTAVSV